METKNKLGVLTMLLAALAVLAKAHIVEYDDYWKEREATARKLAGEAYHSNPVTHCFVECRAIEGLNSTRRHLTGNTRACTATNPIDRCWRCRSNWRNERKRLAHCVKGFGHRTTGGLRGRFYIVTDSSDSSLTDPKPGTLRHAVIQKKPLWIVFARDMVITLQQELIVQGDKTIDGRGAEVHIAYGAGFMIQYVHNVIIHGIHIHDIKRGNGGLIRDSIDHFGLRSASDGDGISIFGSSNVWLDHLSMKSCSDGLIDAIMGSTAITISNCHFTHHDKVLLFGAGDQYPEDEKMQITVAFNHFGEGLVQRMPRCRRGFFHVLNNDYTHWQMYAIGGSMHPTIISQGNRFEAPNDWRAKQVGICNFLPSGPQLLKNYSRHDKITAKHGNYASRLTRFSGAQRRHITGCPLKAKPNVYLKFEAQFQISSHFRAYLAFC